MQNISQDGRRGLNHAAPAKDLPAVDAHLRPARFHERLAARGVDILLEPSPSDSGGAHGAGFRGGVQAELLPGAARFFRRQLEGPFWIPQDRGAVVDGCYLAVQGRVAVVRDGVCCDADEFARSGGGSVVDYGRAECAERTGRDQVVEGLDGYSHPVFSYVQIYGDLVIGEDGLLVGVAIMTVVRRRRRCYC